MSNLVYGTDPEFFAAYTKNNELFCLPPVFFRKYLQLPFTPNDRHPIFIKSKDRIIHEDGAAFEMAVTPQTNWNNLFDLVDQGKRELEKEILSKFTDVCNGKVWTLPTINYEVDRWLNEDDEFQYCTTFGCDADIDAFNTKAQCKVINATHHNKRYGGGHIHISGSEAIKNKPVDAIHSLALTAGLAAVGYSDTPELDKARTYLYGKPGKFRIQRYGKQFNDMPDTEVGIEYRTPSNRWTENKMLARSVFEWAEIGIKYLLEKNLVSELIEQFRQPCIDAILKCDQEEAKNILDVIASRV